MLAQYLIVAVLVALVSAYILRQVWRTWAAKPGQGCGGGCGCSSKSKPAPNTTAAPLISTDELTARLRQRS